MKQLLFLLLFPCLAFAQYQGNGNQKITLGEQTTADGLVFRGVANLDTVTATSKITRANKQDTSVYILLDTVTNLLWHYKINSNAWTQAGGGVSVSSFSAGTTGLTPSSASTGAVTLGGTLAVANGGTGKSSLTANKILVGSGTDTIKSPTNLHWDNTNSRLGIGTPSPTQSLEVSGSSVRMQITGTNNGGNTAVRFSAKDALATTRSGGLYFSNTGINENSFFAISGDDLNYNMVVNSLGNVGIGTTSPTAVLHLKAGTATASTAPLKFTSGVSLEAPEVGAMEFSNISGTNKLYISPANNVRKEIAYTDFTNASGVLPVANGGTGSATKNFVDLTTNQNLIQGTKYFTDIGTGRMSINNTGTLARLQVQGINDEAIAYFYNGNTISKGVYIEGGTDINDYALVVTNKVGTRYLTVFGNGETMLNGTTDRGTYNLQVNGTGVWGEGAYYNGSDANIKENIISLDSSLNIVNNLKPVSFNYINTSVNNDTKHLGFIAQDVYQTLENKDYLHSIVRSDGETLSIAYSNLIPLLTKAIQEQTIIIKQLEDRILTLENK